MDVMIEAAPMGAATQIVQAAVKAVVFIVYKAYALIERVVSSSCPSLGGTSLSAVSPDSDFRGELAVAV